MNVDEALTRWDAFQEKIRTRCSEVLDEAAEGCRALLQIDTLDTLPMSNAWSAIELQINELVHKTEDAWGERVVPVLEDAGWSEARIVQRGQSRDDTTNWMLWEKEKLEIDLFAEAAQGIYDQAKAILAGEYVCTQCGARLEVPRQFFRATHVTCRYCDKVNTFVPGTTVRAVEDFCVHHLSKAHAGALWFEWLHREEDLRQEENKATIAAAEHALRGFYEAYLKARMDIVPEYAESYEKDLQGRMSGFYNTFELRERWEREYREGQDS